MKRFLYHRGTINSHSNNSVFLHCKADLLYSRRLAAGTYWFLSSVLVCVFAYTLKRSCKRDWLWHSCKENESCRNTLQCSTTNVFCFWYKIQQAKARPIVWFSIPISIRHCTFNFCYSINNLHIRRRLVLPLCMCYFWTQDL